MLIIIVKNSTLLHYPVWHIIEQVREMDRKTQSNLSIEKNSLTKTEQRAFLEFCLIKFRQACLELDYHQTISCSTLDSLITIYFCDRNKTSPLLLKEEYIDTRKNKVIKVFQKINSHIDLTASDLVYTSEPFISRLKVIDGNIKIHYALWIKIFNKEYEQFIVFSKLPNTDKVRHACNSIINYLAHAAKYDKKNKCIVIPLEKLSKSYPFTTIEKLKDQLTIKFHIYRSEIEFQQKKHNFIDTCYIHHDVIERRTTGKDHSHLLLCGAFENFYGHHREPLKITIERIEKNNDNSRHIINIENVAILTNVFMHLEPEQLGTASLVNSTFHKYARKTLTHKEYQEKYAFRYSFFSIQKDLSKPNKVTTLDRTLAIALMPQNEHTANALFLFLAKQLAAQLQSDNFFIEIQNTRPCIGIAHNDSQKNDVLNLISVLNKINPRVNLKESDFIRTTILNQPNKCFFAINQGKLLTLFEQPVKAFLDFFHLDKKEQLIHTHKYLTNKIHAICNNEHKANIDSCAGSFNILLKKDNPNFGVIQDSLVNLGFSANNIKEKKYWLTFKFSINNDILLSRLTSKNLSDQFLAEVVDFYNNFGGMLEKQNYKSCL